LHYFGLNEEGSEPLCEELCHLIAYFCVENL